MSPRFGSPLQVQLALMFLYFLPLLSFSPSLIVLSFLRLISIKVSINSSVNSFVVICPLSAPFLHLFLNSLIVCIRNFILVSQDTQAWTPPYTAAHAVNIRALHDVPHHVGRRLKVQHGMAWHDMAWIGMAWYGMAWYMWIHFWIWHIHIRRNMKELQGSLNCRILRQPSWFFLVEQINRKPRTWVRPLPPERSGKTHEQDSGRTSLNNKILQPDRFQRSKILSRKHVSNTLCYKFH